MHDAVREAALDPLLQRVARIDTRRHADDREAGAVAAGLHRIEQAVQQRLPRPLRKLLKAVQQNHERPLQLLGIVRRARQERENMRERRCHRRQDRIGDRLAGAALHDRLRARLVVVGEDDGAVELGQVHAVRVGHIFGEHRVERRGLLLAQRALLHELLRELRKALPVRRVQQARERHEQRRRRTAVHALFAHAPKDRLHNLVSTSTYQALSTPVLAEHEAAISFLGVDRAVEQRVELRPRLLEADTLLAGIRLRVRRVRQRGRKQAQRGAPRCFPRHGAQTNPIPIVPPDTMTSHAPARRRAPRIPAAPASSIDELVAEHTPRTLEDVAPCVQAMLGACDAPFFGTCRG